MIASSFGHLSNLPAPLRPLFDTDQLSLDDIEANPDRFCRSGGCRSCDKRGLIQMDNLPSKVGQVAVARMADWYLAAAKPDNGIPICADCSRLIDTAASRRWFDDMSGTRKPKQAASPIVDLLRTAPGTLQPADRMVQFGKVLPWLD